MLTADAAPFFALIPSVLAIDDDADDAGALASVEVCDCDEAVTDNA